MKCCCFCRHYGVQEIATIFTGEGIFPGRGTCRYNPPIVIMTEQETTETVWPQVHGLDCCSKFRRPYFWSAWFDKIFPSRQTPKPIPHDATNPEEPWKVQSYGDWLDKRKESDDGGKHTNVMDPEYKRRRYEQPYHC